MRRGFCQSVLVLQFRFREQGGGYFRIQSPVSTILACNRDSAVPVLSSTVTVTYFNRGVAAIDFAGVYGKPYICVSMVSAISCVIYGLAKLNLPEPAVITLFCVSTVMDVITAFCAVVSNPF